MADSAVDLKQMMKDLGLKDYQISQHIIESQKILQCENGKYIHMDKLEPWEDDLCLVCESVEKEVKLHKHVSIKHLYEENIVICKKCNVIDSRMFYSFLSKKLEKRLFFPRYPYILELNHGIKSDESFSFNDLVNHFFATRNLLFFIYSAVLLISLDISPG